MKPLLFSILPRPPHPTRDGAAIRNFHLLRALAEEYRVRAFALRAPHIDSGPGDYPPGVQVEEVAQTPRPLRRAAAAAQSLLVGGAYPALLYRSPALDRRLREALETNLPAWIVAHSYHVAPHAIGRSSPAWIDFHNLDSHIWERTAQTASSRAMRVFARLQAPRVRRFESRLLAVGAGISCVSQEDARALEGLVPGLAPLVVPNGVDLERYRFRQTPSTEKMVFFVGDLSWPPNAEAVRWFGDKVWPLLRRRRPDCASEVVGREPPSSLRRLASADFRLLGEQSDTRPFWNRAAVAVVPLQAAGGTRLKILEAAACGVPVVSTSVGAEGLSLRPGSEILIADKAGEFAEAVARLLDATPEGRRLAAAARARVEREYSWPAIGRAFARELLRRSRGR